ncbi:hypothetical protein Hanom_Chr08g00717831 [Helianthus anomalus]
MPNEMAQTFHPPNHIVSCHFPSHSPPLCKKGWFPQTIYKKKKKDDWLGRYWAPPLTLLPHLCHMRQSFPAKVFTDRQKIDGGGYAVQQKDMPLPLPRPPRTP